MVQYLPLAFTELLRDLKKILSILAVRGAHRRAECEEQFTRLSGGHTLHSIHQEQFLLVISNVIISDPGSTYP